MEENRKRRFFIKTYISGQLNGKFIGYLDPKGSNLDCIHPESFYNIEILSGDVFCDENDVIKWQDQDTKKPKVGVPGFFKFKENFPCDLPETFFCKIKFKNGSEKEYELDLKDVYIDNVKLENQVYTENNIVLGDIIGSVGGYIEHEDFIEEKVYIERERQGDYIRETITYEDGVKKVSPWKFSPNPSSKEDSLSGETNPKTPGPLEPPPLGCWGVLWNLFLGALCFGFIAILINNFEELLPFVLAFFGIAFVVFLIESNEKIKAFFAVLFQLCVVVFLAFLCYYFLGFIIANFVILLKILAGLGLLSYLYSSPFFNRLFSWIFNTLLNLFGVVILILFALSLIYIGWMLITPILWIILGVAFIGLIGFIFDKYIENGRLGSFRIIEIAFLLWCFYSFVNLIVDPKPFIPEPIVEEEQVEPIETDELIINPRTWSDFSGNRYSGDIKIKKTDFNNSTSFRKNGHFVVYQDFSNVYRELSNYDSDKLSLLYQMFDSLRIQNNMDLESISFAEMITTCIQNIEYTWVLQRSCEEEKEVVPSGYDCSPWEKYGLYSPVEFMGHLKGDCDTRTLLLYTILKNFNYDVALLISNRYRHSVLGINLPVRGLYKTFNGKRYVLVETTAKEKLGNLHPDCDDPRYWDISLISNK